MGLAGVDTRGEPPPDEGNPSSRTGPGYSYASAVERVGRHAAPAEPVASTATIEGPPIIRDPHISGPDLQTQIRARKAERARVASSVGESVAAPRPNDDRATGTAPKHRRPSKAAAVASLASGRREFSLVRQLIVLAAITTVLVIVLRSFLLASFYIPSASMETTLHGCPGCEPDLVMVDKVSYRFSSVSRGDVVVFDRPPGAPPEDKELIKRVIGLPGDIVSGHDGKVWIGDRPLREPYVNPICDDPSSGNFAPVTVARGRYFMMGDNRCDSFDSRRFGTIARKAIVGRAFAVVWPLKHLRWL